MKTRISTLLSIVAIGGAIGLYTACSDDTNAVVENPDAGGGVGTSSGTSSGHTTSGGDGDAGPPLDASVDEAGNPKNCFDNPKTHFEIINGCTTASTGIVRQQTKSSRLLADGGLPTP